MDLFKSFEFGKLSLSHEQINFASVPWTKHPAFEGVELKHIVTAQRTGGVFSYHLVRVAPFKTIGRHVHDTQLETHEVIDGDGLCIQNEKELVYEKGVISIILSGQQHEVQAGENGLCLFAKFIPALC